MFPRLVAVLSTAALSIGVANAADDDDKKPKRFSLSFSTGIRPDMAQLGSTIAQDGSIDVADTSFGNLAYNTSKALMSDRDNMTLAANSKATESIFNVLESYKAGGSLLGAEFGADVRYELDDVINWPLFIKTGFYHTSRISGGQQSRTLGDLAANSETVGTAVALHNGNPDNENNQINISDYVGGTMKTDWNAQWWEIPISLGIKVHVKPHTFAYGYAGISIFKGGFDVGIDLDETYARIMTTHVDGVNIITDQQVDAVKDTIEFRATAVGLNYGLGAQVGIGRTWSVFVELNSSGAAKTVYAQNLSDNSRKLLTTVSSQSLASGDESWFQTLAYPVVMQGASGRIGVRAYLF